MINYYKLNQIIQKYIFQFIFFVYRVYGIIVLVLVYENTHFSIEIQGGSMKQNYNIILKHKILILNKLRHF